MKSKPVGPTFIVISHQPDARSILEHDLVIGGVELPYFVLSQIAVKLAHDEANDLLLTRTKV
jgi:hypothetical protein